MTEMQKRLDAAMKTVDDATRSMLSLHDALEGLVKAVREGADTTTLEVAVRIGEKALSRLK